MSKPADAAPSLRYYRANEGRWRAPFVFAITSPAAFAQRRLSWLDRLRVRLMALVPQWFGPAVIETSVDATSRIGNGEVVHTTRISKWGFLLYEGLEVMVLDPNGRTTCLVVSQQYVPGYSSTEQRTFCGARSCLTSVGMAAIPSEWQRYHLLAATASVQLALELG